MPIFNDLSNQILFIHVPKAAGTTIEENFLQLDFTMTYRRGGRYGKLNMFDKVNGCSPQHMHAALLDRHFDSGNFDWIFTIVRNPLDRLVSEYNFRKTTMKNFEFKRFDDWILHAFSCFESNPFIYDNHLRPQSEFIWGETEVYKLESELNILFDKISSIADTKKKFDAKSYMTSNKFQNTKNISRSSRKLIEDFYSHDFEYFGY